MPPASGPRLGHAAPASQWIGPLGRGMLAVMRTGLVVVVFACSAPPQPHTVTQPRGDALELRAPPPVQLASGGSVREIASGGSGHFEFSSDSKWLAYQGSDGTHVVELSSMRDRRLASSGKYFQLSPDARWIVQGPQLTRTALDGGAPTRLGGLEVHANGHFVISPDSRWLGLLSASGELATTLLDGGPATRLPVPPPPSGQCHSGSGYARWISADSQWLIYQYGCRSHEAIHRDGSGRHVIDTDVQGGEAIAGDVAIVMDKSSFAIRPLAGGASKTVETPALFGFSGPKVAPDGKSFAFLAADYALHVVEIATGRLDRVSPPKLRISTFVEFTPDGTRLLYPTLGDAGQACAFRIYDLATRRERQLHALGMGGQCFIKPAGNNRAVIHHWDLESGIRQFLLVDLETSKVTELFRGSGSGNYGISPDGKLVAFTTGKQSSLSLISLP